MARAARQLEWANVELSLFTSGAAHDLQGPLRKIIALAARHVDSRLDSARNRDLGRIRDLANRMRALVDYLLAYEQAKTTTLRLGEIDGNEVVADVLGELKDKITLAQAQITTHRLPVVYCDPIQLRQVLHHLLDNAIKFHRPQEHPTIEISGRRLPDGRTGISVKDHGIGIDPRYFTSIFDPFKRLNCPELYDGNGMGLTICRRIMWRHGGQIAIHSRPNSGARFTAVFPPRGDASDSAFGPPYVEGDEETPPYFGGRLA